MDLNFEQRIGNSTLPSFLARYVSNGLSGDQLLLSSLADFQEEAVKEIIGRAYENSPFYREKMSRAGVKPQDITSVADLAIVPFTTKGELRQDPWARLACDRKELL